MKFYKICKISAQITSLAHNRKKIAVNYVMFLLWHLCSDVCVLLFLCYCPTYCVVYQCVWRKNFSINYFTYF